MSMLTKDKLEALEKEENIKQKDEVNIDSQQIAEKAYQLWLDRGCEHGHDIEDWLCAEQALKHCT